MQPTQIENITRDDEVLAVSRGEQEQHQPELQAVEPLLQHKQ